MYYRKSNAFYEERFVAFVDILGFSSLVSRSQNSPEIHAKIHDILTRLQKMQVDNTEDDIMNGRQYGREITVFSDSIVISYSMNTRGCLYYLLQDVMFLQIDLLFTGALLRGGVSAGKLYHDGAIVYGPAMIMAYKLESEFAKWPRVILEDELVKFYLEVAPFNPKEVEVEYINSIVRESANDKYLFLDFLRQEEEMRYHIDHLILLDKARKLICNGLKFPHLQPKYAWLKNYFNEVVFEFGYQGLKI